MSTNQPPEKGLTMSQPESTESHCMGLCGGGKDPSACPSGCDPEPDEAANVPALVPARVAVYAEAIRSRPWGGVPAGLGDWYLEIAGAVVGVADAELAELRAEVERLRSELAELHGYLHGILAHLVDGDAETAMLSARAALSLGSDALPPDALPEELANPRLVAELRATPPSAYSHGVRETVERIKRKQYGDTDAPDEQRAEVERLRERLGIEPVTGLDGRLHGPDGPGSPSCMCGNVYGSVERLSGHLVWAASRLAEGGE